MRQNGRPRFFSDFRAMFRVSIVIISSCSSLPIDSWQENFSQAIPHHPEGDILHPIVMMSSGSPKSRSGSSSPQKRHHHRHKHRAQNQAIQHIIESRSFHSFLTNFHFPSQICMSNIFRLRSALFLGIDGY